MGRAEGAEVAELEVTRRRGTSPRQSSEEVMEARDGLVLASVISGNCLV